jgi:RimJ/RimL family protein N-acetyltransferase
VDGVELVSERLVLRPASEGDLDLYFELRNSPEILARTGLEPRPRSDIERQLRGWIDRWQEHGFGTWTVFHRENDERLGRVELDPMGPGWAGISPDEIEVGFIVHPTHWNRGVATEATDLVMADLLHSSRGDSAGRADDDRQRVVAAHAGEARHAPPWRDAARG